MDHAEKARALFLEGYNRAQAVLCAFDDLTGLDRETSARLASSFGGGMGRMREVCGTVSGALLVLGQLCGYSDPKDSKAKTDHYHLVQEFARRFREINGTIICRELLDGVRTKPGNDPEARTPEYYASRPCLRHVGEAAEIVDELLRGQIESDLQEQELRENLQLVKKVLAKAERYDHACRVLTYDQETICPRDAMEEQGEVIAFLSNQSYKLIKDPIFIEAAENLYARRDQLEKYDRAMAELLHRSYLQNKNITPGLQHEFSLVFNRAFVKWSEAREASDYGMFAPSLKEVVQVNRKMIELRGEDAAGNTPYDCLLDDYERGMTSDVLDEAFGACKERLIPLLEKIVKSPRKIRTDFLHRRTEDEQQARMARWLLEQMQFNFDRGAFTTSEHPFTDGLGRNDARVTTHYYPEQFVSSMYAIIHEGGHALFEQNQPQKEYDFFLTGGKTLGMHESVSRFYENRIGRSKSFVHFIYPQVCRVFPQVMKDVTEEEFYAALNMVRPSLIRTEADEFTYTFHIIIRYEIEKALFSGQAKVEEIRELWNRKYEQYLGIRPSTDRQGVLQDVHWTSGFGYFPTYAIGNFYNAMYYNRMKEEIPVEASVSAGNFEPVNRWMAEHVFAKSDLLAPQEWIRDITGRSFTPDDFLDYLEEKYSGIYLL